MIVSHRHRFVFLKTKKTAGTSVEIALSRVCGPDDLLTPISPRDEETRAALGGRGPQHYDSPPLAEKVFQHGSAQSARRAIGREAWDAYFSFVVERNPWDAVVSLFYYVTRNRPEGAVSFADFVRGPQVERMATRNHRAWHIGGVCVVDRVLRYESLADDLASVWAHLELPGSPELPHAKAGLRPSGSTYRELYDDTTRERVGHLFARAVDELGYTF